MKTKKFVNADGTETTVTTQSWFQRNQKTVLIITGVAILALLLLPDALIKKYVPWVK
jgi:hypothetical protein